MDKQMGLFLGLLIGIPYAVADTLLFRWVTRRAVSSPEHAASILSRGLLGRYALTIAVLAIALLVPQINALGVVVPLIVQKTLLIISSVLEATSGKSGKEVKQK